MSTTRLELTQHLERKHDSQEITSETTEVEISYPILFYSMVTKISILYQFLVFTNPTLIGEKKLTLTQHSIHQDQ